MAKTSSPRSIRRTVEFESLLLRAFKKAGINPKEKGAFARLVILVFRNFLEGVS